MGSRWETCLNPGPEAVGWSSASDTGGVAARAVCPCISCPDGDVFLIFSMTGNWEAGRERTRVQWWSPLRCSSLEGEGGGVELEDFVPYSNVPASEVYTAVHTWPNPWFSQIQFYLNRAVPINFYIVCGHLSVLSYWNDYLLSSFLQKNLQTSVKMFFHPLESIAGKKKKKVLGAAKHNFKGSLYL